MIEAGLVLEGGGMKGVYTAGVLDFFLEKNIKFANCYGVSAGACTMCSYLAGQKGRGFHVMTDYLDDKRYMSLYSLLMTGDLFNAATSYSLVPDYLYPLDHEAFHRYPGKAYAVITNILTGKPEYYRLRNLKKDMKAVRASSSLPLVSRSVEIGHIPYLDGGISDSIPIRRAIMDGNRKNVVILTKDKEYIRKPTQYRTLFKLRYAKYPKVAALMKNRHTVYNETLVYLMQQQEKGKAFVLRPSRSLEIGRTEKDIHKLREMYKLGYEDAKSSYEEMMYYLEGDTYTEHKGSIDHD